MQKRILISFMIAVMLFAPSVFASKLFLNGVDITDLRAKTFSRVKNVRIDENGDVHIDAPQYEVKVLETGAASSDLPADSDIGSPAQLDEQFFIASQGPAKKVQYQLTVSINGVKRLVIDARESTVIKEITEWLNKGKNVIQITAEKKLGPEGRVSTSQSDELSVIIGTGREEKKVVKIESLKASFKCDASTTSTFTREYTIFAR